MSVNFSCLPQSGVIDTYRDLSDIGLINRIGRPKKSIDDMWQALNYDFSENASMHIKSKVSEIIQLSSDRGIEYASL